VTEAFFLQAAYARGSSPVPALFYAFAFVCRVFFTGFSSAGAEVGTVVPLCFGLDLPWLPANILPRRVRLSPFPISISFS
jgi:hypothetical protein